MIGYGTLSVERPKEPPLTTNAMAVLPLNAVVFPSSAGIVNPGGVLCFQGDSQGPDLALKR